MIKDKEVFKEKMNYLKSWRMLWRSRRTITLQLLDNIIDVLEYLEKEVVEKEKQK